jgi:hypothetical protein
MSCTDLLLCVAVVPIHCLKFAAVWRPLLSVFFYLHFGDETQAYILFSLCFISIILPLKLIFPLHGVLQLCWYNFYTTVTVFIICNASASSFYHTGLTRNNYICVRAFVCVCMHTYICKY